MAALMRERLALWAIVICAMAAALWLRLWSLGSPASQNYDEGVYWLTLRAMDAGHTLYRDVFYSQPPAFLEGIYPIYAGLGRSIWSARISIAAFSLVGYAGLGMIGYCCAGLRGVA